jgi:hypothetical protein
MANVMQIGTITLAEPAEFEVHYETAAWRSTVLLAAGTYPVMAAFSSPGVRDAYQVWVKAEGVCIKDHKPTLWGGVPIGDRNAAPDLGKTMAVSGMPPGVSYQSLDLLPGFSIEDRSIYTAIMRERRPEAA